MHSCMGMACFLRFSLILGRPSQCLNACSSEFVLEINERLGGIIISSLVSGFVLFTKTFLLFYFV